MCLNEAMEELNEAGEHLNGPREDLNSRAGHLYQLRGQLPSYARQLYQLEKRNFCRAGGKNGRAGHLNKCGPKKNGRAIRKYSANFRKKCARGKQHSSKKREFVRTERLYHSVANIDALKTSKRHATTLNKLKEQGRAHLAPALKIR